MSWNVVLNTFCEIKEKIMEAGYELWAYDKNTETCLDYWARLLDDEKYNKMVQYLELNEHNDFLLVRYGDYGNVFQGESEVTFDSFWDLYDGFYRECRSVVIDIKRDCLVLTPFRKFRNLNESEETSYENIRKRIEEASCVEFANKLDGSMQSARYYDGQIVMAGSRSLSTEHSWRLEDGHRMLMEQEGYQNMLKDNEDMTFIFEYISKRDAHVVKYDVEGLFLIGIRSVLDGKEASYREVLEFAEKYQIPATEVYNKTLDDVVKELDDKKSSEAEGFVVNIDGYKVKIKYNDYVSMHKMLSAISSINLIIESIAEGKFDDMVAKVPDAYRDRVLKMARTVYGYVNQTNAEIEAAFERAPKIDKKEFMIWVNENVRREIQGFVRCKYYGKDYNVLKKGNGYMKRKDMGIADYEEMLRDE